MPLFYRYVSGESGYEDHNIDMTTVLLQLKHQRLILNRETIVAFLPAAETSKAI